MEEIMKGKGKPTKGNFKLNDSSSKKPPMPPKGKKGEVVIVVGVGKPKKPKGK
jgi:hypothetical protein